MRSPTNDRNSDIDDISVNTNLKVFNGGLGLVKNQKRDYNYGQQTKNEINKMQKYSKEFQDPLEKNFKEHQNINILNNNKNNINNVSSKFKETNLDKENLIQAEGVISFRSKKVSRNENEVEKADIKGITNGILSKIDKLHLKNSMKDVRHLISNRNNDSNANEEHTINKIFKLNDNREIEKEIKNFEKESQRIQSRIFGGNPLESSSSEYSEEESERNDGYNTNKIKRTLDDINMINRNKNEKLRRSALDNSKNYSGKNPINNYNKNYNTISGNQRINFNSNIIDDSANQNSLANDNGDVNEKNIFWNLKRNNSNSASEDVEKSNNNYNNSIKRSKSEKEFNGGKIFYVFMYLFNSNNLI